MQFYITALSLGLSLSALALGIYITMKIFNIPDITTDGSYTLGAVVTALCLTHHQSVWVTLLATLVAGALAGACTGLVHTKLKVNPLLSGILVMTALYSINLTVLGRSNQPLLNTDSVFNALGQTNNTTNGTFIILFLIVVLLVLLVSYLLKTDFGIAMRATGNSETMIRALGVNTDRMKVIGLSIANALVAFTGFLVAQYQGFADISMGIGIVITGLGSVMIAETIINWLDIGSIWLKLLLVVSGAVIFQLILAFTLSIGVDPNLLKLVTAIFVLIIVSIPRFRSERI